MSDKFKNKYTVQSARMKDYDYSQDGMYFVTICAKDREHFFGEIENEIMKLSDVGKIVQEEWLQTPKIRGNVFLDEWVIMPNHMHGIIEIRNDYINTPETPVETPRRGVSTNDAETQNKNQRGGYNPNWKPNSLGSIVNQFKSVCTKKIWKYGNPNFAWQPRFYDHIIRNDESLNKIREYIQTNPAMWKRDRNNLENLYM